MRKHHAFSKLPIALLASSLVLCGFTSQGPNGDDIHAEVTKEALAGTICPANIEVIINGSKSQDTDVNDAKSEQQRHFETKDLNRSYRYVQQEQKRVLHYALDSDSNADNRTRTLYHFGMMLHTVQDFYSNTNYLKLKVEQLNRTAGSDYDPYDIELFDWAKLAPGKTPAVGGVELKVETAARSAKMEMPLQDTTYGKVARGLAIRETMRQWTYLETLLKNKYGTRADTILLGLKQASCRRKIPTEILDANED